ncbi:unnamed protein product [Victoria cruziana]
MGDRRSTSGWNQMRQAAVAATVTPPPAPAAEAGAGQAMADAGGKDPAGPRKVMVVADPTRESMGALEWALSHALLDKDQLILLHVTPSVTRRSSFSSLLKWPPSNSPAIGGAEGGGGGGGISCVGGGGEKDFLEAMKAACESKLPKSRVGVEMVGMELEGKGPTILSQTRAFAVDLLIIGQRRPTFLAYKLSGSHRPVDAAEYCIENSKCLCVGVQKKGQNTGYLLNTKKHKNFWHLA